jgi:hypothetical protein
MPDEPNVRSELDAAAEAVKKLISTCPDPAERAKLRDKLDAIIGKQQQLANAVIQQQGTQYDEALKALQRANDTIARSIESCNNRDKAIATLASALDAVGRMLA